MSDGRWIVVPNWDKFQHYKDRRPAWIKVYTELAHKDEWLSLTLHQRGVLLTIWLEYALTNGRVSTEMIQKQVGRRFKVSTLEALNHAGFIHFRASKPLARRYPREEVLRTSSKKGRRRPLERPSGGDPQKKKNQALAAAERFVADWHGTDSDAFAEALDEISRRYHTSIGEGDRIRLWESAFSDDT